MYKTESMVVDSLKPLLKSKGFMWSKSREMFIRKTPWGFHSLVWSCYETDSAGTLELSLMIGVRHNNVEDMVNQLGLIYGKESQKYTTTVRRSLEFFPFEGVEGAHRIRRASVESDTTDFVNTVVKLVDGVGDDFYHVYSTVRECSRGLNSPVDAISHQLCNDFEARMYYGLACALLTEPERVKELAKKYIEFATVSEMDHVQIMTDKVSLLMSLSS